MMVVYKCRCVELGTRLGDVVYKCRCVQLGTRLGDGYVQSRYLVWSL